jgi:hypothetical protein
MSHAGKAAGSAFYAFYGANKRQLFEQMTPVIREVASFFIFNYHPLYVHGRSRADSLIAPSRSNS